MLILLSGCGQGKNEEEISAQEETLQAIYLQQTNEAAAETEINTAEELLVEEWQQPGEPPEPFRTLEDSVSGYNA